MLNYKNGSKLILFGTGGETTPGSLWTLDLEDLIASKSTRTARRLLHDDEKGSTMLCVLRCTAFPRVCMRVCVCLCVYMYLNGFLAKRSLKTAVAAGFMVPPVLVDLDLDGMRDIVMAPFGSRVFALSGKDFGVLWTYEERPQAETYSTPAVGYFDDDSVPGNLSSNFIPTYFKLQIERGGGKEAEGKNRSCIRKSRAKITKEHMPPPP